MRATGIAIVVLCACGDDGKTSAPSDASPTGDGSVTDGDPSIDAAPQPDAAPIVCGDGMRVRGEECDDHGTANGDGCDSTCRVEPPAGASADVIAALHAINALRAQADEAGVPMETHVIAAAQAHATYYATNPTAYNGTMLSPHDEDPNFPMGFTGVNFSDRMTAAGYSGSKFFETMAFSGNPTGAVAQWANSVFHRTPLLHPNMTNFGYGIETGTRKADVCDFSSGNAESNTKVVVWPPPNATGVPRQFNRKQEGPNPPAPPNNGDLTGPVISVFFPRNTNGTITTHVIKHAGTELAHTIVTPSTPNVGGLMSGSFALYTDPQPANTTFTVEIAGTIGGQAFTTTWSFTTN